MMATIVRRQDNVRNIGNEEQIVKGAIGNKLV